MPRVDYGPVTANAERVMSRSFVAVLLWSIAAFVIAAASPAGAGAPPQVERCTDCAVGATPAEAVHGRYVRDDLVTPRELRGGAWWYRVRWSTPARWLVIDDGVDRATLFTASGSQTTGIAVSAAHRTVQNSAFRIVGVRPGTWVLLEVSGAMPLRFAAVANAPGGELPLPLAFYFGLMGAAALAALGLALAMREPTIGAYGGWLCAVLLFESVRFDVAPIVVLRIVPLPETVAFYGTLSLALAALLQFARVLLRTRATLRAGDRALRAAMAALPVFATIGWLGIRSGRFPLDALDHAWELAFFAVAAAIGSATALRLRSGSKVALLFACSFGALFAFSSLYVVGMILPLRLSWVGDYGGELGTLAEAAVLAFAITARIAEGRRLERTVASTGDVLLQIDRAGRIVFASPNAAALFAAPPAPRTTAAALIAPDDEAAARHLALLAARGRRAVGELRVRARNGTLWCEAAVRAVRRDGRTAAFAISLRDVSERKAVEDQLARASALRVLEPRGIRVEIFAGRATVDGVDAQLAAREFELLAFLSLRADPVSRDVLIDAIWPDADDDAGGNALRVTVTRVRGRLRARDAILHQRGMYRLGGAIAVDVRTAQHALATENVDALTASATALLCSLPAPLLAREWFASYATLLDTLRSRVVVRACDVLVAAGRAHDAAALAAEVINLDPLDEEGYLACARALVAAGDPAGARRVAHACKEILRTELDTAPSDALVAFVEPSVTGTRLREAGW